MWHFRIPTRFFFGFGAANLLQISGFCCRFPGRKAQWFVTFVRPGSNKWPGALVFCGLHGVSESRISQTVVFLIDFLTREPDFLIKSFPHPIIDLHWDSMGFNYFKLLQFHGPFIFSKLKSSWLVVCVFPWFPERGSLLPYWKWKVTW